MRQNKTQRCLVAAISTTRTSGRVVVPSTRRTAATISPSSVTPTSPIVTTAVTGLSSIVVGLIIVISVLTWRWSTIVVVPPVSLRWVAWRRSTAVGRVVRIGPSARRWRWSSGEIPCARNWGSPAGRHGWHTGSRWGYKSRVKMRCKWVWSIAPIVHATTSTTTAERCAPK